MSGPMFGSTDPFSRGTIQSGTRRFDGVPPLRQLIGPGVPGVVYAHVANHNFKNVQEDPEPDPAKRWGNVRGFTDVYDIEGPSGVVSCRLVAKGRKIPGQDPNSGARLVWLDRDIFIQTGIEPTTSEKRYLAKFNYETPPVPGTPNGTAEIPVEQLPPTPTKVETHSPNPGPSGKLAKKGSG